MYEDLGRLAKQTLSLVTKNHSVKVDYDESHGLF